jgi:hypothetical protein
MAPRNTDPTQPWNSYEYKNDPYAPHNDPYRYDSPFEPWNDVAGNSQDLNTTDKNYYGVNN